ncbi:hypothetical protein BGW36DRAFT_375844 [Talaromyces proteolyticus]|uniref:Vacuolar membrane protein n=1 Tax=Talaromyces proteolyticus TaxID=1131652 RepID=A0AAD4KQJ3_9EURO|nr:uncharacterized protein BGW36DRAFT_375844 [Talaromyces proteolyticus]KAH8698299.1 hypothetical protein BGW36DRAFT_375844 [Talaromyces proteolyticus]
MNIFGARLASQPPLFLVGLLATLVILVQVNGDDTTTTNALPALTTTTTDSTSTSTGLPRLTESTSNSIPIPTATVPPTSNAPYMQQSKVPEGTVFIGVGAALGFIGFSLLAWRAMVAWSINRSVRRAAYELAQSENKSLLRNKRRSRRHSTHRKSRREARGTSMSMDKLSKSDRISHLSSTKNPASQSNLFFSPTAGAGSHQSMNRASTYLPAGYYAAGNATLGSHSQVNLGRSPPGSPSLPPSRGHDANRSSHHVGASTSTLNLNVPPQGRAPSAYLEDLFDSHPPARPTDSEQSR